MTNQEKSAIRPLSKDEEVVVEALHFMLSFVELQQETGLNEITLRLILEKLISDGLIQILVWSELENDFISRDRVAQSLSSCSFLATKAGLFSFHSS